MLLAEKHQILLLDNSKQRPPGHNPSHLDLKHYTTTEVTPPRVEAPSRRGEDALQSGINIQYKEGEEDNSDTIKMSHTGPRWNNRGRMRGRGRGRYNNNNTQQSDKR